MPPANSSSISLAGTVFFASSAGSAIDHRAPEHEAAERADVAAALAAFEDEAARAFLQEQRNQVGRGHVQEGRHAGRLEAHRLVGPAAGDDRVARPERGGARELLVEQSLRREAEQADAPGPVAEQLLGVGEQALERRSLEQREGDHRQGAAVGDRGGELGDVGHAGHRPLHDRQAQLQRSGRAARLRRSAGFDRGAQVPFDRRCRSPAARPRHAGTAFATAAAKQASWPIGRRPVAGSLQPIASAATSGRSPAKPRPVAARDQRARGRVAGANQHAEVLAALAVADGDRFAAREVADQGAQRCRQLDLVHAAAAGCRARRRQRRRRCTPPRRAGSGRRGGTAAGRSGRATSAAG